MAPSDEGAVTPNGVTGGVSYRTRDTPSVKNQSFFPAPPEGGAKAPYGRCRSIGATHIFL